MLDFLIENFGSGIFVLRAMTDRAQRWVEEQYSDFPPFNGGRVVEERYIGFVRRSLPRHGFVVTETSLQRAD